MTYIQTRAEQMVTATLQRGSSCVGMVVSLEFISGRGCPQSTHMHHSGLSILSELHGILQRLRKEITGLMHHHKNEDHQEAWLLFFCSKTSYLAKCLNSAKNHSVSTGLPLVCSACLKGVTVLNA